MKTLKFDILIIGGGFAGLSTAYHLAKAGQRSVAVIEQEKKLGGHASGRNAGMIRQAVSDPILAALAREGRNALRTAAKNGFGDINFRSNGSLLLSKSDAALSLEKIKRVLRNEKVAARFISRQSAQNFVPLLKEGRFDRALFCSGDALVDIGLLLKSFLTVLKKYRVPVLCGQRVGKILKTGGSFLVKTNKSNFLVSKIVNAAGACAGIVGEKAGAFKIPLKAYRRHLFLSNSFSGLDKRHWPFVWDIGSGFYFRPVGNKLLLSPCDKTPVSRKYSLRGKEKQDPRMKQALLAKLNHFSKKLGSARLGSPKSGLRTMTPDERFVVGEDPKLKGFFWVAGLGGHGVTTCFSVGKLASDLVLNVKRDKAIAAALSPERFKKYASKS